MEVDATTAATADVFRVTLLPVSFHDQVFHRDLVDFPAGDNGKGRANGCVATHVVIEAKIRIESKGPTSQVFGQGRRCHHEACCILFIEDGYAVPYLVIRRVG